MSHLASSVSGPFLSPRGTSDAPDKLFVESALLSEYWTHVDYFPNHQQLNEKTEMALINTLRFYVVGECIEHIILPQDDLTGDVICRRYDLTGLYISLRRKGMYAVHQVTRGLQR